MKDLSHEERKCIEKMLDQGISRRKIAKALCRSKSTIGEEIKRNTEAYEKRYDADLAQARSVRRKTRKKKPPKLELDKELKEKVIEKLREDLSPEQISGWILRTKGKKISYETIYKFVYSEEGRMLKLWQHLRHNKSSRRKKIGTRSKRNKIMIKERVSIKERPVEANNKIEIGHLESDSMIFSLQKFILSVQVDRKTQKAVLTLLANKGAEETKTALRRAIMDEYGEQNVKTITFDNGTENALHTEIKRDYDVQTYFCRPYASWQKGLVENINKLIRQYLPRKTDMSKLTQDNIHEIQEKLNNRPRKSLNFLTPNQAYKILLEGGRIDT